MTKYKTSSSTDTLKAIARSQMYSTKVQNELETFFLGGAINKVKNALGIDIEVGYHMGKKEVVTSWLRGYDKNFKNHISNPQILMDPTSKELPIFNHPFILRIDNGTFVYVYILNNKNDSDDYGFGIYIFGKHAPKHYRKVSKLIKDRVNTNNAMYQITGFVSSDKSTHWSCTGSSYFPRPMNTIFLEEGKKDMITNHLDKWLSNEEIYTDRGLIFKTGILLYGVPGTGKSSMANAIATYLGCNMVIIDTATFSHIDIASVIQSINSDNKRYVVLIDEVDAIFKSRDDENLTETQKENTSKLLSLLDSSQSPTNVCFVATTNYIERLDKAVKRKGRFDLMVELGDIPKAVGKRMCESFELDSMQADKILAEYDTDTVNPADLQAKILEVVKGRSSDGKTES